MANATKLPSLSEITFVQLSRPDAPNPRLASAISSTATTIVLENPPLDSDGAAITEAMLIGIRDQNSYVETVYVPAGGVSSTTLTGCIRGVRLDGLDWTTGDTDLAVSHKAGDAVFCNISGVIGALYTAAINGTVATGGAGFTIGTEGGAETVTLYRTTTAGVKLGFSRWLLGTGKAQYSNDGSAWVNYEDVSASDLLKVSAADTTPGYLDTKVTVTSGAGATVTKSITDAGGDERFNIDVALNTSILGVDAHDVYTPAYLTGDTGAEGTYSNWLAVLDGSFRITVDGTAVNVDAIDFTGVTDMDDVAAIIQVALRVATSGTETVVWSTNKFVITSGDATSSSAITVTSTSSGTVGTDISGAGGSDWMDCDTGNGTVTDVVRNDAADAGKLTKLDASGHIDGGFMPDNLRGAAETGSTDITGTELETLSDGSDADDLHRHAFTKELVGVGAAEDKLLNFQYPIIAANWTASAGTFSDNWGYGYLTHTSAASLITTIAPIGRMDGSTHSLHWNGTYTKITMECLVVGDATYLSAGNVGFGLVAGPNSLLDYDNASSNACTFAIGAADGKLYAHTASAGGGANHTEVEITGITVTNKNLYRIEITSGVDVKFYVNGILKATITTTLPSTTNAGIKIGFGCPANALVSMTPVNISVEY